MTDIYSDVALSLLKIEAELRRLEFWEEEPPTPAQFASELPFSHDTLKFTQWLQFVFLVRMQELVQAGAPLPRECAIAPYADEYFRSAWDETERLRSLIGEIDAILTSADC